MSTIPWRRRSTVAPRKVSGIVIGYEAESASPSLIYIITV